MSRSYLIINDKNQLFENEIKNADAIIINIVDASEMFNDFEKYSFIFKGLKDLRKEVYIKFDIMNLTSTYKFLNNIKGEYITGWFIPHASLSVLNKLVVKARDYEQSQKMNFGTLNFIVAIDSPENIMQITKISKYERVKAVTFDSNGYRNYLGLPHHFDSSYLKQQVVMYASIAKKEVIDEISTNDSFEDNLNYGKSIGCFSKMTMDYNQLERINDCYTPTLKNVNYAKKVVQAYYEVKKGKRKKLIVDGNIISVNHLLKCKTILERYSIINQNDEVNNLNVVVKRSKIKDISYRKPINKFYTLGEEIGNAISHGIGIAFAIVYLIVLLIKGIDEGNQLNIWAYVVYSLSAIILYSMSTIYHGLPLGSKSKKLFQKFDHMTIYLLIAGTYTPFTLLAIGGKTGIYLCTILWASAFIGLLLNLFWFGRFRAFHMILYVALGWVAIFFIGQIITALGTIGTVLLIAGGLSYTLGLIFYGLKLFKFTHMVWHFFVLIGTILHFITILLYL